MVRRFLKVASIIVVLSFSGCIGPMIQKAFPDWFGWYDPVAAWLIGLDALLVSVAIVLIIWRIVIYIKDGL